MKDGEIVVPEPSKTEVVNRLSVLNAETEGLRGLLDVLEASPMLGNFSPDQLAVFGGADALVENLAELIALVSGEMRARWDWRQVLAAVRAYAVKQAVEQREQATEQSRRWLAPRHEQPAVAATGVTLDPP